MHYLVVHSDETKVYARELAKFSEVKEVLPHTGEILALWATMSRYKKPMTKDKSVILSRVLETLTPLEKAKAFDF